MFTRNNYILSHSAKGTSWKTHKYIKVENGKYFYPADYKGGRHISDKNKQDIIESKEPAGWENKFYSEFESNLKRIGKELSPAEIQEMLLFGKNSDGSKYDNFQVALAEMAGIDADKIDPQSLNLMRYKVVEHYRQKFKKEKGEDINNNDDKESTNKSKKKEEGSTTKSSSSSTKKKSSSKKKSKSKSKESSSTKKSITKTSTEPKPTTKRKTVTNKTGTAYNPDNKGRKKKYITNKNGSYYSPKSVHHSAIIVPKYEIGPVDFNPRHIF